LVSRDVKGWEAGSQIAQFSNVKAGVAKGGGLGARQLDHGRADVSADDTVAASSYCQRVTAAATSRIEDDTGLIVLQQPKQERPFDLQAAGPVGHDVKKGSQPVVKARCV